MGTLYRCCETFLWLRFPSFILSCISRDDDIEAVSFLFRLLFIDSNAVKRANSYIQHQTSISRAVLVRLRPANRQDGSQQALVRFSFELPPNFSPVPFAY